MNNSDSDALIFFGATGDLAFKKIFPSLQAMIKRGNLNVPVIGVAKAGWGIEQFSSSCRGNSDLSPSVWRRSRRNCSGGTDVFPGHK
jgi:glucose-6-phosphate 1-dehydrogenase